MIETKIPMTAQRPSGFVMPAASPAALQGTRVVAASGMTAVADCIVPTHDARVRYVAGDALVTGAFPGLTAWSPPTC